jgi:hypothetical protein
VGRPFGPAGYRSCRPGAIERILGDDLADPDARFALEVVLRALRSRERATPEDASREHGPEHEIH